MEKNTVWFIVTSVVFLLAWYHFFPPQASVPPKALTESDNRSSSQLSAQTDSATNRSALKGLKKSGKAAPLEQTEKIVETQIAKMVMDSQGAGVRHWWIQEKGNEIDLVNLPSRNPESLPITTFPEVNFEQVKSGAGTPGMAAWKATLPSGIECVKKVSFAPGTPFAELELLFANPTKSRITMENFMIGWNGGLGTVESERSENDGVTRVLAYPTPEKDVKVFKPGIYPQDYKWVAVDNRYYLAAFFPKPGDFSQIIVEKSKVNPGSLRLLCPSMTLNPGEVKNFNLSLYAGPKGYTALKKWNMSLEHAVDFGFFGFLGRTALKAMYAVHKLTHNYGFAIIVLTLGLQLIVFPLTIKSYKSMAIMKRLQPKMQGIQTRYKEDPKRLSAEMMNLYKDAGTTPFSGCLPMLIQMPVFIAFFTMLRNSYELHGAPWVGWIHDLSKHDPLYILPVLTGGIMFLQQRISGTGTMDPTQKQMMTFMPIVFTVMFLRSPSGLALYWLTNSLISMVVQTWAARKYGEKPKPTPQLQAIR